MANKHVLIGLTQSEKNNYAQCPSCEEIRRVNEFKIIRNEILPKDTLDKLLQTELEFEKKKIIYNPTEKSIWKVNNLFERSTMSKIKARHNLEDNCFIGNTIDYISFDGHFTVHRLNETSFVEIKIGDAPLLSQEEW